MLVTRIPRLLRFTGNNGTNQLLTVLIQFSQQVVTTRQYFQVLPNIFGQ
jgi:hypothetical protein